MENGTNQKKIFQFIDSLKTTILDAELVNVPIVNENGITAGGKVKFRIGIKIKLAPPPQMALSQNAKIVARNIKVILKIIFIIQLNYFYPSWEYDILKLPILE